MRNDIIFRLINVSLRAGTLVCKFLLIFFLAKFLTPGEVGVYGLLVATIGYAFFVVGFEFYTYTSRELIGVEERKWLPIIRDQWVFFAISYTCMTPVLFFVFEFDLLPYKYLGWFLLLFFLEHTAQEVNRLLVAMSEQFLASFILFLRSGIWTVVVVLAMWVYPDLRNLDFVFLAWSVGAGVACILGFARFFRLDRIKLGDKPDWAWIIKGVKVSIPLLLASLSIRGIFTFDRYWVEASAGLDVLGSYILFAGIAFSIVSFLDAGVIAFLYPKVVAAAKEKDDASFKRQMKDLAVNIVVSTVIMAVVALLVSPLILGWIGKSIYADGIYLLRWLLLAVTIYSFSMIFHIGLYAKRNDKTILYSQFSGLLVFFAGCMAGVPKYGAVAVVWAMCLSFTLILAWKFFAYKLVCDVQESSI